MDFVDITDWTQLQAAFESFFRGLGKVQVGEKRVSFVSCAPSVTTSFAIERDGRFHASMPLHELELRAVAVELDPLNFEVHLLGEGGVSYTYRVPPSLRTFAPLRAAGD